MPRPLSAVLEDLLQGSTPDLVAEAATLLATRASSTRCPRKSIAASLRELTGKRLAADLCQELTETAMALLQTTRPHESRSAPVQMADWLVLEEAAQELKLSARSLKTRLVEPQYRRMYGWPWWDGHCWRFAGPALRAATRSQFLATLPADEPQADLLPTWCAR